MSFPVIIVIMLLAGIAGGFINFLLPSNTDAEGKKIRKALACIVLGTGATILVPLFLEIAQSKLMDNIHYGRQLQQKNCDCNMAGSDTIMLNVAITDTTKKNVPDSVKKTDTAKVKVPVTNSAKIAAKDCCVPLKNYFLFAAYCLVAAAAGIRFINSLVDSVLKEKQITELKDKNAKTEAEKEKEKEAKEKIEKEKNKLAAQDMREAEEIESLTQRTGKVRIASVYENLGNEETAIGPVTVANDRQKGRFGGYPFKNDRKLSATVADRPNGIFYNFTLTVESSNIDKPLKGEVIFYLHDSFSPNVVTVPVIEGKAVYNNIAYGAFTAGAVVDSGNTLLELDLADPKLGFPKEFRER